MDIELFCDKLDRGEITDSGSFLQDDPLQRMFYR